MESRRLCSDRRCWESTRAAMPELSMNESPEKSSTTSWGPSSMILPSTPVSSGAVAMSSSPARKTTLSPLSPTTLAENPSVDGLIGALTRSSHRARACSSSLSLVSHDAALSFQGAGKSYPTPLGRQGGTTPRMAVDQVLRRAPPQFRSPSPGVALREGVERRAMGIVPTDDLISLLAQDHEAITERFAELGHADPDVRGQLFWELMDQLVRHEVAEGGGVYPALRQEPGGAVIAEARRREESEAERVLARLEDLDPLTEEFLGAVRELESAVHEHAQKEEAEVFPLLTAHEELVCRVLLG